MLVLCSVHSNTRLECFILILVVSVPQAECLEVCLHPSYNEKNLTQLPQYSPEVMHVLFSQAYLLAVMEEDLQ